MPVLITRPVLAKQEVRELAKNIPPNVWIQSITVSANPTTRNDQTIRLRGFVGELLQVKRCYPSLYAPLQTVQFNTPIEGSGNYLFWDDFVNAVGAADDLCTSYKYADASKPHVDRPLSIRLFIKQLELVEAQATHPKYRELKKDNWAKPRDQDDSFYDSLPCTFATFGGTYQLLGEPKHAARNGILPGETNMTMNLVQLKTVRTKHFMRTDTHGVWRAYHRGSDDVSIENEESIIKDPSLARGFLPSCWEAGIIQEMDIEGDWNNLRRFQLDDISLRSSKDE